MICEACKKDAPVLHVSPGSVSRQIGVCRACYREHHAKVYPLHAVPDLPEDEVAPPEEELQTAFAEE